MTRSRQSPDEDLGNLCQLVLASYEVGMFPMGEEEPSRDVLWYYPKKRGILPIDGFRASRRLLRTLRSERFAVTMNRAFGLVIDGCAEREYTWINTTIRSIYCALHRDRHAHSLEVWQNETLVGGTYGVAIGRAFFGESMFFRRPDASKVALAFLVDHLKRTGFRLLDTQFTSRHLQSLGGIEIKRTTYLKLLGQALGTERTGNRFLSQPLAESGAVVAQRINQTS